MFIKLVILSVIFLALAGAGLGISILLKPKGKFPETHISRNPEMRKRGIKCAQHNDIGCNPTEGFPGCASCGVQRIY
jgi:hypothetical protein